jgi:hypothetical protein
MITNFLTPSPEAIAAQKEQRTANRDARSEELTRLRGLLDDFTNEKKISGFLPEDVEWIKKFLKERIAKIQTSPTITADQIDALKNDKESLKFDYLFESLRARAAFHEEFDNLRGSYSDKAEELKKKRKAVPPEFAAAIKISEAAQKWVKANMFETKDVYESKREEYFEQFRAKFPDAQLGNVEKSAEAAEAARCKKRDTFSIGGLFKEVLGYIGGYFALFLILTLMILGSSLAVNLNLYRNWAFRIFYAFYGAIFFALVIPYSLFYRWAWLGKKPKFYSLIPLFPYHWDSRIMQILFGWISYRPDADIEGLREWEAFVE